MTYLPVVDERFFEQHDLDYVKVLNTENNTKLENNLDILKDVSIAISAMVTSYARIYMNKIKLAILNKEGKIYYSDTDSIATEIYLETINNNLVDKDIGQFKLEYSIKEAYFLSNKTYCLLLDNDITIVKAKGVVSSFFKYR